MVGLLVHELVQALLGLWMSCTHDTIVISDRVRPEPLAAGAVRDQSVSGERSERGDRADADDVDAAFQP